MKIAIIGAGRMGRRHVLVGQSIGLKVVGVCDPQPAALEAARVECSISVDVCFADPATMLEMTRPEVVVVATTATTHCALTCLAAERGAWMILCEKPMAVSLAECDRVITTCARHGAQLAVNHQI